MAIDGIGIRSEGSRIPPRARQRDAGERPDAAPRAEINFIPAAESLATLIRSAVAALRKGVYWDRGSILNLVV